MNQPHPNADVLIALAQGKTIQFRSALTVREWVDWDRTKYCALNPATQCSYEHWRVKPEPKPDLIYRIGLDGPDVPQSYSPKIHFILQGPFSVQDGHANVEVIFDGETNELKAIRML